MIPLLLHLVPDDASMGFKDSHAAYVITLADGARKYYHGNADSVVTYLKALGFKGLVVHKLQHMCVDVHNDVQQNEDARILFRNACRDLATAQIATGYQAERSPMAVLATRPNVQVSVPDNHFTMTPPFWYLLMSYDRKMLGTL